MKYLVPVAVVIGVIALIVSVTIHEFRDRQRPFPVVRAEAQARCNERPIAGAYAGGRFFPCIDLRKKP